MYFNQIRMQLGGETALISIQGGQLLQESKDKSLQPLNSDKVVKVIYNWFQPASDYHRRTMGNQENWKPGHYQVWIIGWTNSDVKSIGNWFRRYHLWKWPRCHRFDWSIFVAKLETIIGWKVHSRSIQINSCHRACHRRHKLLLYWRLYNEVFGPPLLRLH